MANNKKTFYRICKLDMLAYVNGSVGPYRFFNRRLWGDVLTHLGETKYEKFPFSSEEGDVFFKYASNECAAYKKFNIDNSRLKYVPTLLTDPRPGPLEDFELREKLTNYMNGVHSRPREYHLYCFDTIKDLYKWYYVDEEIAFLKKFNFGIVKFKGLLKNHLSGLRQSIHIPKNTWLLPLEIKSL